MTATDVRLIFTIRRRLLEDIKRLQIPSRLRQEFYREFVTPADTVLRKAEKVSLDYVEAERQQDTQAMERARAALRAIQPENAAVGKYALAHDMDECSHG